MHSSKSTFHSKSRCYPADLMEYISTFSASDELRLAGSIMVPRNRTADMQTLVNMV